MSNELGGAFRNGEQTAACLTQCTRVFIPFSCAEENKLLV